IFGMPQTVSAQYEYRIGKGQASIEPDQNVLSLALAGYGAPREGRFSLEWTACANVGKAADVAAMANKLFILREGQLWQNDLSDLKQEAILLQSSENIRMITGGAGLLFAVNVENVLLSAKAPRRGKLRWR